MSSSILALLIALISVMQSATPVFIKALQGDRSRISLSLIRADGHTLKIVAINSGNRPGTIAYGSITLKTADDEYSFPLEGDAAAGLILGDSAKEVSLTLESGFDGQLVSISEERDGPAPKVPTGTVVLTVHSPMQAEAHARVTQFDGSTTDFHWPITITCGNVCHIEVGAKKG
ncbi:MAG: hypothetical protein ACAH11_08995 [Sphingomonas sp.]